MLAGFAFLVIGAQAQFGGGDATDLAQAICKDNDFSAVISVFDRTSYPMFKFVVTDADNLSRSVRTATGLTMSPGPKPIFHTGTLPRHLFQVRRITGAQPWGYTFVNVPADAIKEGKVTWETKKGEALKLGAIGGTGFSKKINVHWLFSDLQLIVKSKALSEVEFLTYLAKAAGAKLVSGKDEYRFELDTAELRKTIQDVLSSKDAKSYSGAERSDIELVQAAISAASDGEIKQAFATQGASVKIQISSSNAGLVTQRVQVLMEDQPEQSPIPQSQYGRRQTQGTRGIDAQTLRRIDTNAPAYFILNSDFRTQVEMSLMGGRGGVVRF